MFEVEEPQATSESVFVGEQLLQHHTLQALHTGLQCLTRSLGFSHFLYGTRIPSPAGPVDHVLSDHPEAWRERYARQQFQRVDPTLAHCLTRITPLPWHQAGGTREQAEFMEEARAHGLQAGVSVPVRGLNGAVGMLSLSLDSGTSAALRHIRELVPQAQTLACYAHEAMHNLPPNALATAPGMQPVRLSPRELQCLSWVAQGKSNWETARILGVSEHGVSFHLRNLMRKMEVSSRHVAVRMAIEMGLLKM